jgi:hypothetical protein
MMDFPVEGGEFHSMKFPVNILKRIISRLKQVNFPVEAGEFHGWCGEFPG